MSFTLTSQVTEATLPKVLPRGFAVFASSLHFPEPITVTVFDASVVISGAARRALRKVAATHGRSLLFVARDFTQEARDLIESHGAHILSQANFGWSDEDYIAIRTRTPVA